MTHIRYLELRFSFLPLFSTLLSLFLLSFHGLFDFAGVVFDLANEL